VESFHNKPKGLLRNTSLSLIGKRCVQQVIIKLRKYTLLHIYTYLWIIKKINAIEDRYDRAFRVGQVDDLNMMAVKLTDNQPVLLASQSFITEHGTPAELETIGFGVTTQHILGCSLK